MTITELAARSGFSVRNIRAYQARGLLPPPEIRGRAGHYDQEHLDRLALVRALREEGLNLATITTVVSRGSRYAQELRRLRAELHDPVEVSGREWVRLEDRAAAGTEERAPGALQRFIELGSIRRTTDGGYESPAVLVDGSWELNALGASPEAIIEMLLATGQATRRLADAYMRVLRETDVVPRGGGEIDVEGVRSTFEEVRPVLVRVVAAMFEISMARSLGARMDEHLAAAGGA
ncbi:MAG: MerR family transcriptional regulator [Actinomycetia bacterium]|nr:MerR family transcriptional regulator [Actinomycetes bacterium]